MQTTIISRLPNMSASLDMIGVATALDSRVAVTSHDASSADTPRMAGKSGNNGITIVCCSATTVPHNDRMAMTDQVGTDFLVRTGSLMSVAPSPAGRIRSHQTP